MVHVLKKKRLEKQLAQRLSELILFELSDSLLQNEIISITRVEVTSDFFRASVYFTLLNEAHKNRIIKALYRAAPFLYKLLIKRIRIRRLPELKFFYDTKPSWEQHAQKLADEHKAHSLEFFGDSSVKKDLEENPETFPEKDEKEEEKKKEKRSPE